MHKCSGSLNENKSVVFISHCDSLLICSQPHVLKQSSTQVLQLAMPWLLVQMARFASAAVAMATSQCGTSTIRLQSGRHIGPLSVPRVLYLSLKSSQTYLLYLTSHFLFFHFYLDFQQKSHLQNPTAAESHLLWICIISNLGHTSCP